ncbi:DinB family protein [Streptomyces sp. NPDC059009]|uniref:DinB family protein n=1 Tax=Streptomyces sp. NPDC059009 TaxID=3346694 RepID=UPI00367FB9D2
MTESRASQDSPAASGPRPKGDVPPPGINADERETLLAFLNYLREAIISKAQGVDEEQARAVGVPSGTSLLGLIKHLIEAEFNWFVWAFRGADTEMRTSGMELGPDDTAESLIAAYRAAGERTDALVRACADLETLCVRDTGGTPPRRSLRWVLVHTVEETARHAGHADILREHIDGSVGR